ncbi:hypothetical protein CYMTET_9798 [Cymbomonas tetramitiformis]|uniref:Uncharacterized protein n=1 Tax=Cymbomonas tetramitiformis TaxID=36881 RepID=A0AAE0GQS8_9CHLO|nr:hypothetical protein CYMTET_9798 [Cymbomonas tetramitiformis]
MSAVTEMQMRCDCGAADVRLSWGASEVRLGWDWFASELRLGCDGGATAVRLSWVATELRMRCDRGVSDNVRGGGSEQKEVKASSEHAGLESA